VADLLRKVVILGYTQGISPVPPFIENPDNERHSYLLFSSQSQAPEF
jgi:hypothetical protein